MSRPTDRSSLLTAATVNHAALEAYLVALPSALRERPGAIGAWSPKDVLNHLAEWHRMFQGWVAAGEAGERPAVPAEGFTWAQTPALNEAIRARHADRTWEEALNEWQAAHAETMRIIEGKPEDELFTKKLIPWTGSTSLAAYAIGATSSHDHWALTEMRKSLGRNP